MSIDSPSTRSTLEERFEEMERQAREQPFWRRPRRLRRQIAGALVLTALVGLVLFGTLNFVAADRLLRAGSEEQLEAVANSRATSIESGAARLLGQVSALAGDVGVADAMVDLGEAFATLDDEELADEQDATLDAYYDDVVVDGLNSTGLVEVTRDEVEPTGDAARWLQYHYTLPAAEDRPPLPDPSSYAEAFERHDDYLTEFAESFGAVDVLLVSNTDEIVYSTEQRIDLGNDLGDGPLSNTRLAQLITEDLGRVRAGQAVISDFSIYVPNRAQPALFAAAAIRRGTQIVGALVIELPGDALDGITTANGRWEEVGLGDGESYVVASDLVLQSQSRPWVEDPEAYLADVSDDEIREAIDVLGNPVGIQPVDTEPVRDAFQGEPFVGRSENYLGRAVFSASTTIDVPGVEWVVVTDTPIDSARQPLTDYLRQIVIAAIIVLPIAALVGIVQARRLARPIGPSVDAARAVAEGERHLDLPRLRNDEFGDLGRRLTRMASRLEDQETELADEYERRRRVMLSVLPSYLVDEGGSLTGTGDSVRVASVVAVKTDADLDQFDADERSELIARLGAVAEDLSERHGLERIRAAADRALYVAGAADDDDAGADAALEFAAALMDTADELRLELGVSFAVHVGISTGPIATGVLDRGQLTFGAWGEPVRRALAISSFSTANEVLVDESTRAATTSTVAMTPVTGIVDLDDEPMDLQALLRPDRRTR